jgi:hypothetical protein
VGKGAGGGADESEQSAGGDESDSGEEGFSGGKRRSGERCGCCCEERGECSDGERPAAAAVTSRAVYWRSGRGSISRLARRVPCSSSPALISTPSRSAKTVASVPTPSTSGWLVCRLPTSTPGPVDASTASAAKPARSSAGARVVRGLTGVALQDRPRRTGAADASRPTPLRRDDRVPLRSRRIRRGGVVWTQGVRGARQGRQLGDEPVPAASRRETGAVRRLRLLRSAGGGRRRVGAGVLEHARGRRHRSRDRARPRTVDACPRRDQTIVSYVVGRVRTASSSSR